MDTFKIVAGVCIILLIVIFLLIWQWVNDQSRKTKEIEKDAIEPRRNFGVSTEKRAMHDFSSKQRKRNKKGQFIKTNGKNNGKHKK